jgi:hypothetical protein
MAGNIKNIRASASGPLRPKMKSRVIDEIESVDFGNLAASEAIKKEVMIMPIGDLAYQIKSYISPVVTYWQRE